MYSGDKNYSHFPPTITQFKTKHSEAKNVKQQTCNVFKK